MKTVLWVLAMILAASMAFYAGPVLAQHVHGHNYGYVYDNDCTGNGDCARDYAELAPKGTTAEIPARDFMLIAKYFNELMSNPPVPGSWNILAASLFDGSNDPTLNDEISDFFVVDIRTPTDFCAGHLPEAINIPYDTLGKPEAMALLPFNKPILLICNGGFNASVAQGVLRILGYDAWALRGGMLSLRANTKFPLAQGIWTDPYTGTQYDERVPMAGLANTGYYQSLSINGGYNPVLVGCQ